MAWNFRVIDIHGKVIKEFYGGTFETMLTVERRARKWQAENLLEGETGIENF